MKINMSDFRKSGTLRVPQKRTAKTGALKEREKTLRATNRELWEAVCIAKMLSIFTFSSTHATEPHNVSQPPTPPPKKVKRKQRMVATHNKILQVSYNVLNQHILFNLI